MKKSKLVPVIVLETKSPINGYWDGGAKDYFVFEPKLCHDKRGYFVKWGSWSANFWYTCGFGKSWKHAATIGAKMLDNKFSARVPYTISIEWKENAGRN